VAAHVDEDALALALSVEAGAAGAEGDRDAAALAEGENFGDIAGVVGHHHDLRQQAVGAGIGGVADDVAGASEHAVGAEQLLEFAPQRLRGAGGKAVGSAVGRRL
jgi:hypothetical protein